MNSYSPSHPTTASAHARVAKIHANATLIVMGFAVLIAIYTALALFMVKGAASSSAAQPRLTFLLIGLFLAGGSILLRRSQFAAARLEAVALTRGINSLISHIFTITLISSGIGEAIGLLSLIVGIVGGEVREIVTLGIMGLIVVLSNYPRRAAWSKTVDFYAATLRE